MAVAVASYEIVPQSIPHCVHYDKNKQIKFCGHENSLPELSTHLPLMVQIQWTPHTYNTEWAVMLILHIITAHVSMQFPILYT